MITVKFQQLLFGFSMGIENRRKESAIYHRSLQYFWLPWAGTFLQITNPDMIYMLFPHTTIQGFHSGNDINPVWSGLLSTLESKKIIDIHMLSNLEHL